MDCRGYLASTSGRGIAKETWQCLMSSRVGTVPDLLSCRRYQLPMMERPSEDFRKFIRLKPLTRRPWETLVVTFPTTATGETA